MPTTSPRSRRWPAATILALAALTATLGGPAALESAASAHMQAASFAAPDAAPGYACSGTCRHP